MSYRQATGVRGGGLVVALLLTLLLALLAGGGARPAGAAGEITFPQTGFTLSNGRGFLSYWQAHGGLAQFGYPLSGEQPEVSPTDGRVYLTQWFERNRFEYHPENAGTPYSVLLGLLGRDLTRGRGGSGPFAPVADPHAPGCRYFPETQHTICRDFLTYWDAHGGLPLYGYPLSEEFAEASPTDGKTYAVQYFERNRFEYHAENAGTPYSVLLGLLGVQIGGFPLAPVPRADTVTPLVVPARLQVDPHWRVPHPMTGPAGMHISLFGTGAGLRMMAVAPNGDLLISSTGTGQVLVMPDRDGDGVADDTVLFAEHLAKPHGLAFHAGYLYVATEAAVLRFPYADRQVHAPGAGQKIADLPAGPGHGLAKDVNHDTRSIAFGPDNKMYISAGSDCDLCEETDPRRAAIRQFNDDGSGGVIFADGLRNAVGLDVDPRTGLLWASVNERNERGNDFPPDLLAPILRKANYGWPYCLGIPLQPDPAYGKPASFCAAGTSAPVGLPAHSAPLGIRFAADRPGLPAGYGYGIFLAVHGSVLHTPTYGADVRFVSLRSGQMAQGAQPAIQGWLVAGEYWGRPVDVVFGRDGALYVSDDRAGAVYRVTFGP